MSDTALHIGRVCFELDVETLPRARAITEKASAFGRRRLPALLADVMADVPERGQVLSFDSIVLDLGTLPEADFERRLAEALERALRAHLLQQGGLLPHTGQRPAHIVPEGDPDWQAMLQLFAGAATRHADRIMERALLRWPLEALVRLRAEGRTQPVRRHLAQYLPLPAMERLLRALEPAEAPLIAMYVKDVCELHRERPLVPESRQGFRAAMWEFVLAYLLLERGSYFNTKSMVGHTLMQMARRYRIAYTELLHRLTECLELDQLPLADRAGLRGILLDLRQDGPAPQPVSSASEVPVAQRRLDAMSGFLERGVWAGPQAQASAREGFAALVDAACDEDPDALAVLLRKAGARPAALRRLAGELPQAGRERLVHLLEPVHGAWIVGTVHGIGQVQAERQVVQDDRQRFGRRLWEFVFSALLVERGSVFNTRTFVKSLVAQLAAHYNMAYRRLLHALIGIAAGLSAPASGSRSLPAILVWLKQESERAEPPAPPEPDALQRRQLQRALRGAVLRHVLGAGAAPSGLRALLAEAMRESARHTGTALPQWLAAAAGQQSQVERLLLQRDDMAAILAALGEELADAQLPVGGGNSTAVPAPIRQPARFARAAREFVLRSFRIERGSYFNNRSYIKQLLHQLSARHGMDYAELLRGLIAQAAIASNPAQTTLPGILLALKAETGEAPARMEQGGAAVQSPPASAAASEEDPVWLFLRHGRLSGARSEALLGKGLASLDSAELAAALRSAGNPVAMLERIIHYLPPDRLHALVEALATGGAGLAETWRLAVLALHGSLPRAALPLAALDALAWRSVFRVLLRRQRGEFSASAFLSAATHLLAPKLGLSGSALVSRLMAAAAARMGGAPRYRVLLELLAQAGGRIAPPQPETGRAAQEPELSADARALGTWLRFGATQAGETPASLLERLLAEPAALAREFLLHAARRQLERHRLGMLLAGPVRKRVLRLLLGAQAAEFAWWCAALATAGGAAAEQAALRTLLRMLSHSGGRAPAAGTWLPAAFANGSASGAMLERVRSALRKLPAARRTAREQVLDEAQKQLDRNAAQQKRNSSAARSTARAEEELPEGELFAVDNAGIVLLWPFLDRYFNMLGMLEGGAFLSERHQHRAVQLLRYLSHGELDAPEHALLLNKILCGLDPAAPLDGGGELTELERDMSVRVLGAVTQNWDKLANTDAEGLQATFIRREGSLVRKDDNWTLAVQRQAFDVLMGSLPWALGTIRLSWMSGILTVDWS